jgi:hypothetical protein
MPGPSRRLEVIVAMFIPPACREEVLGDLQEKYVSPMQYIGLAMCVVPCVILSRLRRTSDPLTRLTEALLIYGSFLAATWYSDRALLSKPEGMLWVALPTAANLIDLIFEDLWRGGSPWPARLVRLAALAVGIGFNIIGEFLTVVVVMGLHLLPGLRLPEASGPSIPVERKSPASAKSVLMASAAVAMAAVFLALAGRSPGPAAMGAIVVFVLLIVFRRPRKE